jgi:chromosome segregation ATPase
MDESRIRSIEVQITDMKADFTELKVVLRDLAKDMHLLAVSSAERASDRTMIERVIKQTEDHQTAMSTQMKLLWDETRKNEQEIKDVVQAQLVRAAAKAQAELDEGKEHRLKWFWETVKVVGSAGSAYLLFHFGIKT